MPTTAQLDHDQLTSLIGSMADGVLAVDKFTKVIVYNGAALNILDEEPANGRRRPGTDAVPRVSYPDVVNLKSVGRVRINRGRILTSRAARADRCTAGECLKQRPRCVEVDVVAAADAGSGDVLG